MNILFTSLFVKSKLDISTAVKEEQSSIIFVISVSDVTLKLDKSSDFNEVHPLKAEVNLSIRDELKLEKSIEMIFFTLESYSEEKKLLKSVRGAVKCITNFEPFFISNCSFLSFSSPSKNTE